MPGRGVDGAYPQTAPATWRPASLPITWPCSNSFYDEWLLSFDLCPVLTIPTDAVDFVHHPMALELVVGRIQEKLGGKDEIDFSKS